MSSYAFAINPLSYEVAFDLSGVGVSADVFYDPALSEGVTLPATVTHPTIFYVGTPGFYWLSLKVGGYERATAGGVPLAINIGTQDLQTFSPHFGSRGLEAPLTLPAAPGAPLTTGGGIVLDNGSGEMAFPNQTTGASDGQLSLSGTTFYLQPIAGSQDGQVALGDGIVVYSPSGAVVGSWTQSSLSFSGHFVPSPSLYTLSPNPLVSATVYQNTSGGLLYIMVPITASAVGGGAQWALGPTSSPAAFGGATQIGVSSESVNVTLWVPANWYYSLTVTSATIGTASAVVY